jgi:hypothetical protein
MLELFPNIELINNRLTVEFYPTIVGLFPSLILTTKTRRVPHARFVAWVLGSPLPSVFVIRDFRSNFLLDESRMKDGTRVWRLALIRRKLSIEK